MDPQVTAAVIAAGISVLTFIGTLAAQYLGRRATSRDTEKTLQEQHKHLDRTLAQQSQQLDQTLAEQRTRTLNERFASAADQLGSDKPAAVRLAGAYAMSGLADDWAENRQTCIDVLCAYLRMPYEPELAEESSLARQLQFRSGREVRHTAIRIISAHLREGAKVSWRGYKFDFTGAVFDGGDFSRIAFAGSDLSFDQAIFAGGRVNFADSDFSGAVVGFSNIEIAGGTVDFSRTEFSDNAIVPFLFATFSGGRVRFDWAKFSAGAITFFDCTFSGSRISFDNATFSGALVGLTGSEVSGGSFGFRGATISEGVLCFTNNKFTGGTLSFAGAKFSGGATVFDGTDFIGSTVSFVKAEFAGGLVALSEPGAWTVPPEFPWIDNPPPEIELPPRPEPVRGDDLSGGG